MLIVFVTGCDLESRIQEKGFNLPKGNAEQGKANFILLQCNDCHSVTNTIPHSGATQIKVALGGKTTQVTTYGDLVTSIIHPDHKLSRRLGPESAKDGDISAMRNYNDVLSVQELIDLVAFLQSEYEIWVPDYYTY